MNRHAHKRRQSSVINRFTSVFTTESDQSWERLGQEDAYFGVVSHPRFKNAHEQGPSRDEFFESGERYIEDTLAKIRLALAPVFAPKRALDFGCGVGRLVIPLAHHVDEVVGVDVSSGMLEEARRNCSREGLKNVTLLESDDQLSMVHGKFDFISSYIVLQHIPIKRGEKIVSLLTERLAPGGVGALHVSFASTRPWWRQIISDAQTRIPLIHLLTNILKGRQLTYPHMQMNRYKLNRLFEIIRKGGSRQVLCEFTNHSGTIGAILYFQNNSGDYGPITALRS